MLETELGPPRRMGWHSQSMASHHPSSGTNIISDEELYQTGLDCGYQGLGAL
jgi:hypothetical protein